ERHLERPAVRDRDELYANLVDFLPQLSRPVEIIREIVDERLHVVVPGLVRLPEGEKHIFLPSASRVGRDADPVARLRRRQPQAGRRGRYQKFAPRYAHLTSPYSPRSIPNRWRGYS